MLLPATLASESAFAHTITTTTVLWSLIAGAALAFAIYAASMSFMAAHSAFRIYVAFALAAAFYIILSSGLLSTLIGARIDFNFGRMVYFAQAVAMAFGTIFIMIFLDMQTTAPRLYRVFYAVACIGLLTGFGFLLPTEFSRLLFFVATGAGPLVLALGLGWMAYRGVQGSRNVLIAWLPCLLATVWVYLRVPEITPYLPINHFLLPIAMAFTLAYLSALLGGRVRESEFWAHTDALTGLGNRRLLDRITELENRQPGERYATAVAIDLDQFKPVNDTHGHAAGDAVLMAVAERLRTHYSGRGDIFRLGGDEFLVLGYQWVTRMDMLTQTNSFLLSLKQSLVYETTRIPVSASAGIAFHDHRHGFSDMLKQADAELYQVKQAGGGSMRIADQRSRDRRDSPPVVLAANNSIDDGSVVTPFTAAR
ncbi:MAG: diguanylate cyclase domain-containing protein [Pararhodobacter sp.]